MSSERRRVLVLGTGTSVGKTYFTSALARALVAECPDLAVSALKPIESGIGSGEPSDAETLERAGAHATPPRPHPLFAFEPPVSPHLAALRAGQEISSTDVRGWLEAHESRLAQELPRRARVCVVETAGACFSPLSSRETNFDLARALDPGVWILVAPDALGVLHDLTVTLALMAQRGRCPDLVVLSQCRPPDASTGTNAEELKRLGIAEPAWVIGRGESELRGLAARLLLALGQA